jgi:phenylpropionate dioxygenase-like ring-hydroxylating dioxygenase large terminal subunit
MITSDEWEKIRLPLESAYTLPPAAYTSPQVFARERQQIFQQEWVCVARVDMVPEPGDFLRVDLSDQPLLVVRQKSADIVVLSAICLHRAMPIAEGKGNVTHFSCPYHLWKYDLTGQLVSAPLMDQAADFDVGECQLPAVRCEIWQGFVFVNLDAEALPLAPRLTELESLISPYGAGSLVVAASTEFDSPWNWKILVENFMEAYHHIGPHKDTFQPTYPANDSHVTAASDHSWSVLHMPSKPSLSQDTPWPALPGLESEHYASLEACLVSPTLLFACNDYMVVWYQLLPTRQDQMTLKIHLLVQPEIAGDPLYTDAIAEVLEGARFIHGEDIPVNEGPWLGYQALLTRQGRLSLLEASIWHMNQWWADRMVSVD